MNARISARELFEQLGERLSLRWLAGERGAERILESVETVARRPSLARFLAPLPHRRPPSRMSGMRRSTR